MKKVILWTILILLLLTIAAGVAFYYFCWLPYEAAANAMPSDGSLVIRQDAYGQLHMSWPEAKVADYYCVELQLPMTAEAIAAEEEPTVIYRDYVFDTACILPEIPSAGELVIQVSSIVEYEAAWETQRRKGDDPIRVTTTLDAPVLEAIEGIPDPDTDSFSISYAPQFATHTRVYQLNEDGSTTLLTTLEDSHLVLTFGEDENLPLPAHGEQYTLIFDAYRVEEDGLEFYGYTCGELTVVREDLLGRELAFTVTDEGYNVYTMTWDETKGDHYLLQQYDAAQDQWLTLANIPKDGERTYTTGHLQNLSEFTFRVLSVGGQTMEDSMYAAESEEISVATVASPIYCTIWPVKDLDAFDAPGGEAVGKVKTATAYCVLEEKDGMFGVMVDGQLRYIDSNYCMINLVEIFGDLCNYDITNSYASLYMVHEYEIPDVTDVITAGYNYVRMSGGEFLVPLLYPTSQKLLIAAQEAQKRGYRLKIYDSYRPNKATVEIYDLTEKILEDPIPEETFTGKKLTDLPEVEEDEEITYELLMTNGTWQLGSFLAKGGSLHNLGIALDLTLEDMNGNELKMQTSMHDLSCYSVLSKNNANAKLLAEIMSVANFGGITSEWWHFQDNEIRAQLKLPTVWAGVTPECWMADDNGWRYRRYNGTYFADCTKEIGGITYVFDAFGYATKAE